MGLISLKVLLKRHLPPKAASMHKAYILFQMSADSLIVIENTTPLKKRNSIQQCIIYNKSTLALGHKGY